MNCLFSIWLVLRSFEGPAARALIRVIRTEIKMEMPRHEQRHIGNKKARREFRPGFLHNFRL